MAVIDDYIVLRHLLKNIYYKMNFIQVGALTALSINPLGSTIKWIYRPIVMTVYRISSFTNLS